MQREDTSVLRSKAAPPEKEKLDKSKPPAEGIMKIFVPDGLRGRMGASIVVRGKDSWSTIAPRVICSRGNLDIGHSRVSVKEAEGAALKAKVMAVGPGDERVMEKELSSGESTECAIDGVYCNITLTETYEGARRGLPTIPPKRATVEEKGRIEMITGGVLGRGDVLHIEEDLWIENEGKGGEGPKLVVVSRGERIPVPIVKEGEKYHVDAPGAVKAGQRLALSIASVFANSNEVEVVITLESVPKREEERKGNE